MTQDRFDPAKDAANREKHKLLAVRFLPPSGTLELAVLDDTFALDGGKL